MQRGRGDHAFDETTSMSARDEAREDTSERVRDLTLMLLYLTRWTETPRKKLPPGFEVAWRAWKGHDWDALDRLKEQRLIDCNYRAKSVGSTDQGEQEAQQLLRRYGIQGEDEKDG